jgi:hypothetical protein
VASAADRHTVGVEGPPAPAYTRNAVPVSVGVPRRGSTPETLTMICGRVMRYSSDRLAGGTAVRVGWVLSHQRQLGRG